jgi:hypothetical protein
MYRKSTANVLTVFLVALLLTPLLAGAQGSVETQKGLPPDPNAITPEYARPKPAPDRPGLEPSPGQPALAPKLGVDGQAQPTGLVRWAFLRFWPILLLGAGAGFLVVGAANVRRRSRRTMRP